MHDSQAHDIQTKLDEIFTSARSRFGHGAFFMEAAGGEGGDAPAGDAPAGDAPEGDGDKPAAEGDKPDKAKGGDKGDSLWADPAKAKAEIERLRRENAADRTTAKTKAAEDAKAEIAQTIGKALGLVQDDAKNQDPAELVTQIKAAQTIARESAAELVVWRHAAALKVDAAAVTDSRAFADAIKDLDPTDAKAFEEAVKNAAQDAVKKNPKLAAAPVAGKGGAELTGGSGEQRKRTPKSLEDAVKGHYGS